MNPYARGKHAADLSAAKSDEFKAIRLGAAVKLRKVGESPLANDLESCNEDCSLEGTEHAMRQRLKGLGPDCLPETAKALAGAIVDAQLLRGKLV